MPHAGQFWSTASTHTSSIHSSSLYLSDQSAQVNNVLWNSGLNPYDYLAECYGGIPGADGIIEDSGDHVVMMHPDAVNMPAERYQQYMQVGSELRSGALAQRQSNC